MIFDKEGRVRSDLLQDLVAGGVRPSQLTGRDDIAYRRQCAEFWLC